MTALPRSADQALINLAVRRLGDQVDDPGAFGAGASNLTSQHVTARASSLKLGNIALSCIATTVKTSVRLVFTVVAMQCQFSVAVNADEFDGRLRQEISSAGVAATSDALPGTIAIDHSVIVSANTTALGATIPASFTGLSWEKVSLTRGVFVPGNTGLISLLQLLGPNGTLRIGGNSSDQSATSSVHITAAIIADLQAFLAAVGPGWRLIYGLNSLTDTAAGVTVEVGLVEAIFGPSVVRYQIGNEPDLHFASEAAYRARWESYHDAISAAYPAAKFLGPDLANSVTSGAGWMQVFLAAEGTKLVGVTEHYYVTGAHDVTPASLLATESVQLAARAKAGARAAGALPVQMTETNSISSGGQPGVSDRSVSAAQLVEEAIILAKAGWAGFNLHGGGDGGAYYNPYVASTGIGGVWMPKPNFAGLVLVSRLNGGQIAPLTILGSAPVEGVAFVGRDGALRYLLVNRNVVNEVRINVAQEGNYTTQRVLTATGPSPTSATETLGGAVIGANGAWAGHSASVPRGTPLVLPPASAMLVTLR